MSRRDLVERLKAVPLLSRLTGRELNHLAKHAELMDVPGDASVVLQGDHGAGVFVLLEGGARVVRNKRTVARLKPGAHFGELALLDPGPRTASVVTTEPSRLALIDATTFRALLRESPAMAERLLQTLAHRAREAGLDD